MALAGCSLLLGQNPLGRRPGRAVLASLPAGRQDSKLGRGRHASMPFWWSRPPI